MEEQILLQSLPEYPSKVYQRNNAENYRHDDSQDSRIY
jgi:hypothetical protein